MRLAASARVGAGGGYSVAARSIASRVTRRGTPFVDATPTPIGALWIRAGISVTRLFAVPELTATSDADAESPRALARSWTAALLPPAVLANNEDGTRRRAPRRWGPATALRARTVACVFAQLFPASLSTSEARRPGVAAAAKAALRGDLMIRAAGPPPRRTSTRSSFATSPPRRAALALAGGRAARSGRRRGGRRRGDQGADAAALHPRAVEARGRGASGRVREEHGSPSVRGRRRVQDGGGPRAALSPWTGDRPLRVFARRTASWLPRATPGPWASPSPGSARLIDLLGDEALRPSTCRHAIPCCAARRDAAVGAEATRLPLARRGAARAGTRPRSRAPRGGLSRGAVGGRLTARGVHARGGGGGARRSFAPRRRRGGEDRRRRACRGRRGDASPGACAPPPRRSRRRARDSERASTAVDGARARAAAGVPCPRGSDRSMAKAPIGDPGLGARRFARACARRWSARGNSRRRRAPRASAWRLAAARDGVRGRNPDGARRGARGRDRSALVRPRRFGAFEALPGAPFAEPSGGGGGSALAAAAAPDAEDPAFAAAALRILSGLLCDSSSATVQLAASTTRLVLASRAARSAWDKHLSPLERAFLAPLAPADDADPEEAERDALRKSEAAASRDETHSQRAATARTPANTTRGSRSRRPALDPRRRAV